MQKTHTVENSNTFLAYFNQIDKFFEVVLGATDYMPYTEKIEKVARGIYPVSAFVKKFQQKLKYFGDLRNQIVHGFRLDQHHYLLVSEYALDQIKKTYTHLTTPPIVGQKFLKTPQKVDTKALLTDTLTMMIAEGRSCIPVYDAEMYRDFLSYPKGIAALLRKKDDIHAQVSDALQSNNELILFMDTKTSIYELEGVFTTYRDDEKSLIAIFLTTDGTPHSPLQGIITPHELPQLDEEMVL